MRCGVGVLSVALMSLLLILLGLDSTLTIFHLCVHVGSACSNIFSSGADKPLSVFSAGHPGQEPALQKIRDQSSQWTATDGHAASHLPSSA